MKRSSKDWLYIVGLFLMTVLSLINHINQGVKAVMIIAIFVCVGIVKFVIEDKESSNDTR